MSSAAPGPGGPNPGPSSPTGPRSEGPETYDEWVELDRERVWHPYTQHGLIPDSIPVVRAEGSYLVDPEGRAILDAISSWWVTLHGHAHPVLAEAVAEQARTLEQVIFAGFTHEPAARLAAELVEILPGDFSRVFYSDDGSTSVEVAVKIALQHWKNRGEERTLVAALENAYHGDTFGAMSVSARSVFTEPFGDHLFEVPRLGDPVDGDPVADLERLLDDRGDELAAVIVEPLLLGAGGMRVWEEDLLRAMRERTREHGVLLIADEVLTGFGRTGPLFACERAGVTPDIVCLSKGLTGGFLPMGATVVGEEIFESFRSTDRRRTLFHGHSYTANPLACAVGRASLRILRDEACTERRRRIEEAHREHLPRIAEHPLVENPRILGTMAACDLIVEDDRGPMEGSGGSATAGDGEGVSRALAEDGYLDPIGRQLETWALDQGVLLRPLGNVVYLLPPYCTTPEEIADIYGVIERFLEAR